MFCIPDWPDRAQSVIFFVNCTLMEAILTAERFEQLFRERYDQLYYFAYDYVRDGVVAEDIVSEVFTAVWNRRESLSSGNLNSYLHVSVRNRCFDYLRNRKRATFLEEFRAEHLPQSDEDWQDWEDKISALQQELQSLPERTLLMLKEKFLNGKTYKELSDLLGISPDGVKKLVSRTYDDLREKITKKLGIGITLFWVFFVILENWIR